VDLILIIIFTFILVPIVLLTSDLPRIVLGLLFTFLFPGYTLVAALFPRKSDLGTVERIALCFGLSIVIVCLIGLLLNYTPLGVRLVAVVISIASFTFIASAIALYRRRILPKEQRFELKPHISLSGWREHKLDRALTLLLTLSLIGAVGTLGYVTTMPKVGEKFTDFYVLGPTGMAEDYPHHLVVGEEGKVILGIINKESQEMNYFVEVRIEGDKVQELGPISLPHEGKWESEVVFAPERVGENQKVEFLLFKSEKSEPYRELHLWVDVRSEK
jgi:uncharacterized membrane protein